MNMEVTNEYGYELAYDAACMFMDDEIREELHMDMVPCGEQEFLDAYCKARESKFGEAWFLAEPNPTW